MKRLTINRIYQNDDKTLSHSFLTKKQGNVVTKLMEFKGIELPWNDNQRNISCIPADIYTGQAIQRGSNGDYAIHIKDVPNRSEILIHKANFVRDLLGCLAPGKRFKDIDKDGIIDVDSSEAVMLELEKHVSLWEKVEIHIIDIFKFNGNEKPKN